MTAIALPDGRWVVPGNRWDLVPSRPRPPATVTVVIPYFRQQAQLDLVLEGLTLQTHPASSLQVVIADDGSPVAPDVASYRTALDPVVVRQPDRGFRAAAARNLGVSAADGSVICFLDADTVPEPDYVENSVRLPAALPDALVVGRRRHADLSGWSALDVRAWFTDPAASAPEELTEPRWLREAYDGSRDLLDADRRSYRHVISAVMTCTREFFIDIGQFDEAFVGYGGEDWELAHRAYDAGAVFAHARDAVAWHDGADWAERTDAHDRVAKNGEAVALAPLITDPAARTHGVVYAIPQIVAVVDADRHSAASLLVTVGSLVSNGDCQVWIAGDAAASHRHTWRDNDSRVHLGEPADPGRSRLVVMVHRPVRLRPGALDQLVALVDSTDAGQVVVAAGDDVVMTVTTSRSMARARRWAEQLETTPSALAEKLFGTQRRSATELGVETIDDEPRLAW